MTPDALRVAAYIAALILSPAVFLAALRLIFLAGKWAQSLDSLIKFANEATKQLQNHETRIAVLEKEEET